MSNLSACALCPRACGVDRTAGQRGRCHETATVRIARASLHMWEEPCLSGDRGSGTVFFTGCPLGCVFCQNYNIADGTNGAEVSPTELTDIFLKLQDMGAHNINLVTPTHFVPAIVPALERAKELGLGLPVVYNTGTYEAVETLRMLDGLVDIWLPDFKYVSPELAARYSFAPDYFDVASAALEEMARQTRGNLFDLDGMMTRGIIVRHLILPGCTEDSKAVLKYLWDTYGDDICLSIMDQYTPLPRIATLAGGKYKELDRRVTAAEYDDVVNYAVDLGITNAFVQEGEAASESFIPDFEHFDVNAFLER
ncbi:MAG: radical SAM protein [Ruminococcaceae bacterium]|nr:radical SAM protein [Oscillospiraceae bacterium]